MITFDEACRLMMGSVIPTGTETVPLHKALNRVLAQDVHSDTDMPPFDKSAMDGYACRRADLGNDLQVVEHVPAGREPTRVIVANQCTKIMTGSMVPEGADCVIMVEYTESTGPETIRFTNETTGTNICRKGEDIQAGMLILKTGERITPAHIATLAAVGCSQPAVAVRPRVGVIATGSELIEPDQPVSGAMIRNSNGWQLAAQIEKMGSIANNCGIAEDSEDALDRALKVALSENDLVLLSGGVSMGDFDLVPGVMADNGIELLFDRVAVKPGKPSTFGTGDNVRCMGLPGNPVATYVQFELMVKPFLYKMMGHAFRQPVCTATLSKPVKQKKMTRINIVPVRFDSPSTITPVDYHGSAHISAMCRADGVITIPSDNGEIPEGTKLEVRLLP